MTAAIKLRFIPYVAYGEINPGMGDAPGPLSDVILLNAGFQYGGTVGNPDGEAI